MTEVAFDVGYDLNTFAPKTAEQHDKELKTRSLRIIKNRRKVKVVAPLKIILASALAITVSIIMIYSQVVLNELTSEVSFYENQITELDTDKITVVATGPLTSPDMAVAISSLTGGSELHFFDAAAPIVDFSTVDMSSAFFASRYGKGDPEDYLNCPMTREEYDAFYNELVKADVAPLKDFDRELQEDLTVFEGCMPVEVMASRGYDTLRFGPMKPVGLPLPTTGEDAYATVQLRRENREGTMYNIVGFQTHLTFPEQRRVFRMIPGLENAEFFRYGVMHRNTYLNSPGMLTPLYSMQKHEKLFFAGQMTGVEGYIESTSSGFVAGVNAALKALGEEPLIFPPETEIGALASYVSNGGVSSTFQPMNANFGIIAPFDKKVKGGKKARNEAYAKRSMDIINADFVPFFKK